MRSARSLAYVVASMFLLAAPRDASAFGDHAYSSWPTGPVHRGFEKAESLSDGNRFMSNATLYLQSNALGNEVYYASADGQLYLWASGQQKIVRGRWSVLMYTFPTYGMGAKREVPRPTICIELDTADDSLRMANPCMSVSSVHLMVSERRAGDFLGLARRSDVPFRLRRSPMSLSEIGRGG